MARLLSSALCALVGVALSPAGVAADVVDRAAGGFTVRTTVQISAAPEAVYKALVDIGAWWGRDHTYSGDATNMTIDPRPGGCFCEKLPNGGVEHGRVVQVRPGQLLRLATALGPLQELGVAGNMTWQIAAAGQGSTVTMTYAVGGHAPGGLEKLAGPVDQVLAEQVRSLKTYVERGGA
jgi:uncharacterized protein YndB with AHSA1/START domain